MTVTALVPEDGLDDALTAAVSAGCARAGVALQTWRGTQPLRSSGTRTLVLDVLPTGQRSLPRTVTAALTAGHPVLLLCREPLAPALVAVEPGRLHLVGEPFESDKLDHAIRTVLAAQADAGPGSRTTTAGDVRVHEHWGAGYWCLTACAGDAGAAVVAGEDLVLAMFGATAAAERTWRDLQASREQPPTDLPRLATALQPKRGVWTFGVSAAPAAAWLLSPQRLPAAYDLSTAGDRVRTLPRASGDVCVRGNFALDEAETRSLIDSTNRRGGRQSLPLLAAAVARRGGNAAVFVMEAI